MEAKFWAADLAAYNAGLLRGAWIDVDSDAEAMGLAVRKMLAKSPESNVRRECPWCEGDGTETRHNSETGETRLAPCQHCNGAGQLDSAEEWTVHDWDDESGAFRDMGETSDLDAIAARAEVVESLSDDHAPEILALLIAWAAGLDSDPNTWESMIEDAFAGVWNDPEDYAADYVDSAGLLDGASELVCRYVDFRAMALDFVRGGDIDFICTATGRYLKSYDEMRGNECIALHCH